MKKVSLLPALCLLSTAIVLTLSSCGKKATTPQATCTIIFNDSITRIADSIHYDYYSGTPRIQAFIGTTAVITLWPGTFTTHRQSLTRQYLYWIVTEPTVYSVDANGGTLSLTNDKDLLSGTLSASGTVWSGATASTPATSTVSATFSNVKQLGH